MNKKIGNYEVEIENDGYSHVYYEGYSASLCTMNHTGKLFGEDGEHIVPKQTQEKIGRAVYNHSISTCADAR